MQEPLPTENGEILFPAPTPKSFYNLVINEEQIESYISDTVKIF